MPLHSLLRRGKHQTSPERSPLLGSDARRVSSSPNDPKRSEEQEQLSRVTTKDGRVRSTDGPRNLGGLAEEASYDEGSAEAELDEKDPFCLLQYHGRAESTGTELHRVAFVGVLL